MICRSVTACCSLNRLSGTFHDFRKSLIGASSESLPCSTYRSAAMAATGFEIDAAWNTVSVPTGVAFPVSSTP